MNMNEEDTVEFELQVKDQTEVDLCEKLEKAVRAHLVNHLPTLVGRVTTVVILTKFRETLNSQEAKDIITKAIKELNNEPTTDRF